MVDFPTQPTIVEPVAPDLFDIRMPGELVLNLPEMVQIEPIFSGGNAPTGIAFLYASYGTTIQDVLDGKIEGYFTYSVPLNIEVLKWGEVREQIVSKQPSSDEFLKKDALRGFNIPTGNVASLINKNDISLRKTLSDENFKQISQHAELEAGLLEFASKAVNTREEIVFDSHHRIQAATLDVAVQLARDISIAYRIDLDKYNSELRKWDIKVVNWRTNIQRQLLTLEGYKENLKATKIQIEAKNAIWALYEAKSKWMVLEADIQIIQLEEYTTKNEVKLAQLKKNAAEYDLYTARINANTALFRVYRADIEAELVKLEKYKVEVQVALERARAANDITDTVRNEAEDQIRVGNAKLRARRVQLAKAYEELNVARIGAQEVALRYDIDLSTYLGKLDSWSGGITESFDSYDEYGSRVKDSYTSDVGIAGREDADQLRVDDDSDRIYNVAYYARQRANQKADISAHSKLTATLIHQIISGK
ncbi:MAG TPA: hypothetical protein ENI76_02850 [Ignavibacteria bacterium]|nr:hypothetical protein [Ignavibacteria bacterium]